MVIVGSVSENKVRYREGSLSGWMLDTEWPSITERDGMVVGNKGKCLTQRKWSISESIVFVDASRQ